jgi:hypothetical protein
MPSLFTRELRVVRFIPSRAATPTGLADNPVRILGAKATVRSFRKNILKLVGDETILIVPDEIARAPTCG